MASSTAAEQLRLAADWLDAHPDLPEPTLVTWYDTGAVNIDWQYTDDADAAGAVIAALRGRWTRMDGWQIRYYQQRHPGGVKLSVHAPLPEQVTA